MKFRMGIACKFGIHLKWVAVPVCGSQIVDLRKGRRLLTAAIMRLASLGAAPPPFPVSISTDSADGARKAWHYAFHIKHVKCLILPRLPCRREAAPAR